MDPPHALADWTCACASSRLSLDAGACDPSRDALVRAQVHAVGVGWDWIVAAVGREGRRSSVLKTGVKGTRKPADGFEPTAFALQKRCSTTELSRQWGHCTGAHLLKRLRPLHPPERELQPGSAA